MYKKDRGDIDMRINCIPVEDLADQHLRAEWVEMLMLPAYLKRSVVSKDGLILYEGKEYVLNTGHARFFYDKLSYVYLRYKEIEVEMNKRGFRTNPTLDLTMFPKSLFGRWIPTKEDQVANLNRILTRIQTKPKWYSYYGEKIDDWISFYEKKFNFKYELKLSDIKKS